MERNIEIDDNDRKNFRGAKTILDNGPNDNCLNELSPQERLKYLIIKYFGTQSKFAEKAKINVKLINNYIKNRTKKISDKSLITIEANVGFSKKFIVEGVSNELLPGIDLKPIITPQTGYILSVSPMKSVVYTEKFEKGEAKSVTLEMWGKNMTLSPEPVRNIVNIGLDGIEDPMYIRISTPQFCDKYGIICLIERRNLVGQIVAQRFLLLWR